MKKPIKYLLFCLTAILLILAPAGCSFELPGFSSTTTTQELTTAANNTISTTETATDTTTTTASEWTLPVTASGSYLPDMVSVVAKVKPSVVAVNIEIVGYDIFNRQYTSEGAGSGWVISADGYIATNNHVIEDAANISVTFEDESSAPAIVVGADAVSDLAVLKVDRTGLTAAAIGDSSKLQTGEWVLALGNALGEGISATQGIVSRMGASITVDSGQTLYDLIQTSTAINSGNSGGPLVNMAGEVVGITSAKLAAVGVEGMGYAISMKTAVPILESLVEKGYVIRPYLGVYMESVSQWLKMRYDLAVDYGAFLNQVETPSPAANAGLKAGDIITSFNGVNIETAADCQQAIRSARIGETVEIKYYRGNTEYTTQATLMETPAS